EGVIDFPLIQQAVVIRVGVVGLGAVGELLGVGQAVAIQVTGRAVHASGAGGLEPILHFPAIRQAVAVGIGHARVGAVGVFLNVGQVVAVGVAAGAVDAHGAGRAERVGHFPAIRQAVTIGVGHDGVGAALILLQVGAAVSIGVTGR